MPAKFEACMKMGGKVRRVSGPSSRWKLKAGQWRNICFLPSGKTYKGYTKKKGKG